MNKIIMILIIFFIVKEIIVTVGLLVGTIEVEKPFEIGAFILYPLLIPILVIVLILKGIRESRTTFIIETDKEDYKISKRLFYKYRKKIIRQTERKTKRKIWATSSRQKVKEVTSVFDKTYIKTLKRIRTFKNLNNVVSWKFEFEDEID